MSPLFALVSFLGVFLSALALPITSSGDLLSIVVLYRHGDRAPIAPYANDPYNETFWPLGFGQLTNIGKKQQYQLGKWLRTRYNDFLPDTYNKNDIKIQSSNVDRCLMSAQLNLAGLYPPQGNQIWNENLKWQPIPIHTIPEEEDALLAQERACPKYKKLFDEVANMDPFKTLYENYTDLMAYVSDNSGENITTFEELLDLYNTVYIENLHNLTQPDWTEKLLTEDIENLAGIIWTSYAYTKDLARLRSGPLLDLIISHFEDVDNNVSDTPKFLMLSAHDSTIAPILTAMEVYDGKWPNYASSVLFEMRSGESGNVINIFYRNNDDIANLTLPNCDFDCHFDKFSEILDPVRLNMEAWETECQE